MALEDTMSNMLFLGEQMASTGKIFTKDYILEEINKVDIGTIKQVTDSVFTDNKLRLVLIGPQKAKEKRGIEELLHF